METQKDNEIPRNNADMFRDCSQVPIDGMTSTSPSPEEVVMADQQIDEVLERDHEVRELVKLLGLDRNEIRCALLA